MCIHVHMCTACMCGGWVGGGGWVGLGVGGDVNQSKKHLCINI